MEAKGWGEEVVVVAEEEGCMTPKHGELQIPAAMVCPPPPKKKRHLLNGKREPPKNGYFHPPELESIFKLLARRQEIVLD
ncbi:hypothetical protein NMG60_11034085 [Bertholletia excelsa]